jgi:hypothetical protein
MPAAVITQWTGAVDGDYSDNANWTNNVPTTNGTADVYFTTGSVDCNENLPVTVDNVDYRQLTIGPKYTGTIGSSTVPLELDDVIDVVYAQKTGQVFLHADITSKLIVESTSTSNPSLALVADAGSSASTLVGETYITGGNGTVLFEKLVLSGDVYMVDCKGVTLDVGADCAIATTDFFVGEGRLLLNYMPTTGGITITDGLVEILDNGNQNLDSLTMYGGTVKWKLTPSSSNNIITLLNMYGGFFDARAATAAALTITAATIYKGAIIDERNGLSNITYSADIITHGGVVMCDPFRTITVTS